MLRNVDIIKTENPKDCLNEDNLLKSILSHQNNVLKVMEMLSEHILDIGEVHDWTKTDYFDDFVKDCIERKDNPVFINRDWYNIHCELERHHLNSKVPENVDFFDILESIVDCLVTAKSQGEKINPFFLILREDVLQEAYWNTVYKIANNIKLEKKKKNKE